MEKQTMYPRTFSHISLTVPNVDKAIEFYTSVFGLTLLVPPFVGKEDSRTQLGQVCLQTIGTGFGEIRIAVLGSGNGIGIELLEFPGKTVPNAQRDPYKTGMAHYCLMRHCISKLF